MAKLGAVSVHRAPASRDGRISSHEIVRKAEEYFRSHGEFRLGIARLSRDLGRSERGLRHAFYRVYGVGPKRWMVAERLRAVRQALCTTSDSTATVTSIAANHGFSELGRFAKSYREQFGETPSETLRGRCRNATLPT